MGDFTRGLPPAVAAGLEMQYRNLQTRVRASGLYRHEPAEFQAACRTYAATAARWS